MRRSHRRSALAGTFVLAALLATATAEARTLGSNLFATADAGVCSTPPTSLEATCTVTQRWLAHRDAAQAAVRSGRTGVIGRWWVRSGEASVATAAVGLRLRVLEGDEPVPGAQTPYLPLPLDKPGLNEFPARLPIEAGQRLALDIDVHGSGLGMASAPIGHSSRGIGEIAEWVPALGPGLRSPAKLAGDTELMLRAAVEADRDEDGWGDATQDRCPYDPRRHTPCLPDTLKPRIRISFAPRQDFIARHKLFLRIRTFDYVRVHTAGVLNSGRTGWGLLGSEAWMEPGQSAVFTTYVNGDPLAAAKRAVASGGHPYVRAVVYVTDASGNRRFQERRVTLPGR